VVQIKGNMIEKLLQNPDQPFALADEEAKILLFELGVVDRFKKSDELLTQAVIVNEHLTHRILALHFSGQPDPLENGFQVTCFPRSKVSADKFQDFVSEFRLGTAIYVEGFAGPATNN
jgi:hypothetical protein